MVNIKGFLNLERAAFRSRPNRFTVECRLTLPGGGQEGRPIKAYLPNPGRLWELLLPGKILCLAKNPSKGKIPYTVIAAERDGIPILLHTHLANTLVEGLIKEKRLPGFKDTEIIKREVVFGNSRYDFLLSRNKRPLVLEVKTCTLFSDKVAMFPDAVTARGSRHLMELSELTEKGIDGGILFVVQWPLTKYFMPDYHTDLDFSRNLLKARDRLLIKAIAVGLKEGLSVALKVRELIIPWELIEKEAQDRGSYIVILYLNKSLCLEIGGLGRIHFRKGYYLYAGSAMKELTKRVQRHKSKKKKTFWHIDYLTLVASFYKALPIRTEAHLECEISQRLKEIADWSIRDFGSSDCTCGSHLFGMKEDPIRSPLFIEMLQYFRIGRVAQLLHR